jgi:hypothetical protein
MIFVIAQYHLSTLHRKCLMGIQEDPIIAKNVLPVQVWNQLVFIMTHARSKVGYSNICLL